MSITFKHRYIHFHFSSITLLVIFNFILFLLITVHCNSTHTHTQKRSTIFCACHFLVKNIFKYLHRLLAFVFSSFWFRLTLWTQKPIDTLRFYYTPRECFTGNVTARSSNNGAAVCIGSGKRTPPSTAIRCGHNNT